LMTYTPYQPRFFVRTNVRATSLSNNQTWLTSKC